MFAATTLLTTQDPHLADTVRRVVESVRSCELRLLASTEEALDYLTDETTGLVIALKINNIQIYFVFYL